MKRKSTISDLALLFIVLMIFTVIAIIMYHVAQQLFASSQTGNGLNSEAMYYGVAATKNMDFAIALLVVFFIIGIGAAAYALTTSPMFIPFFIFLAVALVVLGSWFGNTFLTMFSTTEIAAHAQDFSLTTTIFSRLPLIIAGAGLLIMAFLYLKPARSA